MIPFVKGPVCSGNAPDPRRRATPKRCSRRIRLYASLPRRCAKTGKSHLAKEPLDRRHSGCSECTLRRKHCQRQVRDVVCSTPHIQSMQGGRMWILVAEAREPLAHWASCHCDLGRSLGISGRQALPLIDSIPSLLSSRRRCLAADD